MGLIAGTKIQFWQTKRFPPGESLKVCLRYSMSPRERLVSVPKLVYVSMYIYVSVCVPVCEHPKQFRLIKGNFETMPNSLLLKTIKKLIYVIHIVNCLNKHMCT